MSELVAPAFSGPENLLIMVKDICIILREWWDERCGFGGTFCVFEEVVFVKIGKDRIKEYEANHVEYITAIDVNYLMHLEGILKREKSDIQERHIAEILNVDEQQLK